jgi:hypothetical protein
VAHRKGVGPAHRVDDGEARKADQNERLIGSTDNPSKPTPQVISVSDGRDAVGTVEHRGGYFVAINIDGRIIGRFRNLKIAVRALPEGGR